MDSIIKKASREVLMALLFFLPEARRIRIERWLRGRDETSRLAEADVAIVSFGKSGRTWLRVMLSRYYQLVYDIPERILLGFANYHRREPSIPKIFFTHDNYIKDYTGELNSKAIGSAYLASDNVPILVVSSLPGVTALDAFNPFEAKSGNTFAESRQIVPTDHLSLGE